MQNDAARSLLIVFVSNNAWSVYNFRLDVLRSLMAAGHRVVVLSPVDDYAEKLISEGCHFREVSFDNRSTSPINDLKLYSNLRSLYKTLKPDLIFHYVAKPNIYGTMAATSLGIPSVAVVTGLGYAFSKKNLLNFIVKVLYRRALKGAKEVWFLNNEDAGIFSREKIAAIEKIKVLPGEGVNTEYFMPAPCTGSKSNKFRFLMSCRLLKSKGISIYADACRILQKKHYEFESLLVGFFEGHHPDSISKQDLQKWENEGLISYRGYAPDVRPWLAQADCFIFPTYYNEGVPRSLMEAASMTLPVITSRTRGCKEVVMDGETGFLCNPSDPFDLADKMEEILLMNPEHRKEMGRKGRNWMISHFDISRVKAEYHALVEGI